MSFSHRIRRLVTLQLALRLGVRLVSPVFELTDHCLVLSCLVVSGYNECCAKVNEIRYFRSRHLPRKEQSFVVIHTDQYVCNWPFFIYDMFASNLLLFTILLSQLNPYGQYSATTALNATTLG